MPQRTQTSDQNVVDVNDGRTYNFTDTAKSPHKICIEVDADHDYERSRLLGWHETHGEVLTCVKGRVLTSKAYGMYSGVASSFGEGSSDNFQRWTLYYWTRDDNGPARASGNGNTSETYPNPPDKRVPEPDLEAQLDDGNPPAHSDRYSGEVIVDISINPDYWDLIYGRKYELFHRNYASMVMDAHLYPLLQTTPFLIRFLFKLPWFLFPQVLRDWLIAYFLSIQLLVLISTFDFHPYMGRPPISAIYMLLTRGIIVWPEQPPEWVSKWEWNTQIVISHLKVAFWSRVGKRLLGMSGTYDEYSPERLTHSGE